MFSNPYKYTSRSGHTPKRAVASAASREAALVPSKRRYLLKAVGQDSRGTYNYANQYTTEGSAIRRLANICRSKKGLGRGVVYDLKMGNLVIAKGDSSGIQRKNTRGMRRHRNAINPKSLRTANPLNFVSGFGGSPVGGRQTARAEKLERKGNRQTMIEVEHSSKTTPSRKKTTPSRKKTTKRKGHAPKNVRKDAKGVFRSMKPDSVTMRAYVEPLDTGIDHGFDIFAKSRPGAHTPKKQTRSSKKLGRRSFVRR